MSFNGTKASGTYQIVGFDWGSGLPDPDVGPYTFSASWTGQVPTSGVYTLNTKTDDGVLPFVGGKQRVEIDAFGATDGFLQSCCTCKDGLWGGETVEA